MQSRVHIQLDTPSDGLDGITISAAGTFECATQFEEITRSAHFLLDAFTDPKPWPCKTAESNDKEPKTP